MATTDPGLLQACAMVLGSPQSQSPDVDACRLIFADAARETGQLGWPVVTVVVVLVLALVYLLDQWWKGHYTSRGKKRGND